MASSIKIYKYVGPKYVDRVFADDKNATLKLSLPKDFNDPYELFLTIDFNEEPDALAFYADVIGEMPQFPTTCFSRSPLVVPMWAHYAENHQGLVIEFSEEKIAKAFPKSRFGDVSYSDTPQQNLSNVLHMAFALAKPRYTYFLRGGVFNAAYFTKASCWSYEHERRMVVQDEKTREVDGLCLLDVPLDCVTGIVCGSRSAEGTKSKLIKKTEEIGCRYFELRIGKTSAIPYFVDAEGRPFSFDAAGIIENKHHFQSCKEPIAAEAKECSWCQIDDEMRDHAASRNPYRILDAMGLLESYVAGADAVGEKIGKGGSSS